MADGVEGRRTASDPAQLHRVILHLDLDCFYAQVEAKRLGIPPEVPLAVQQWQGIIAVNYPARAAGVKRHLNVTEAGALYSFVHSLNVIRSLNVSASLRENCRYTRGERRVSESKAHT